VFDGAIPVPVYTGKINQMNNVPIDLDIWAGGSAAHTFTFKVSFPEGGKPVAATSGDNMYQKSSMTISFKWEAVSI